MIIVNEEVWKLWIYASRSIYNRFQIDVVLQPDSIQIINDDEADRFGGHFDKETGALCFSETTRDGRIPWQGIVYRESLFHSLPQNLCKEARNDIACEFARQILGKSDQKTWEKTWKKQTSVRINVNLSYDSFLMMNWVISLGGEGELDSLLHEFKSMAKYGRNLEFRDYIEYMTKRTQKIEAGLNSTEIKIIDALIRDKTITFSKLAKNIKLSDSWVSTIINRLKRRYILVAGTSTPFSRIGIRTIHVLLGSEPDDEPSRYIEDCPFVFNIQHVLNGPWQVLARLAVPDNHDSMQSIYAMEDILQQNGIAVDITETTSVAALNSFYHYNVANRRWEIPWVAMHGWGQRITDESLAELVERVDTPAKPTDAYINELDIAILDLINKKVSSSRILRQMLKVGQSRLSEHLNKLYSEGLIRKDWTVYNIGLVERVALRVHDRKMSKMLDLWSRELPQTYLRYEDPRNLLVISELPAGGSTEMMKIIRELGWSVNISLLGGRVWGQWTFPTHLWNVENQSWDAPIEEIASWQNQLLQEIETEVKRPSLTRILSRQE